MVRLDCGGTVAVYPSSRDKGTDMRRHDRSYERTGSSIPRQLSRAVPQCSTPRPRATPRANVNLVRAYTQHDFYGGIAGDEDMLHLIADADATTLQTGNGRSMVRADEVERLGNKGWLSIPEIVVSTACSFSSSAWHNALKVAGARVLVAATGAVTPANLTAFDMSFYSAPLSQVRRGKSNIQRVKETFELANRHYEAIHAVGTPHAKFRLTEL